MTVPRWPIYLSIAAALLTMAMKTVAYLLTGSVGMLSDALESGVNLVAALAAWVALRVASMPVDANHAYGHSKIEYFSCGLEGMLILAAGIAGAIVSGQRLFVKSHLEEAVTGAAIAAVASLVNLVVGLILVNIGKRSRSITLEADGRHLLTDVLTSLAVVVGLLGVRFSGIAEIDPLVGLIIAVTICRTGIQLVHQAFDGLMDHALPMAEQERLRQQIRAFLPSNTAFHALRTRQAGVRQYIDFHLLVPGIWSMTRAHQLAETVEKHLQPNEGELNVTIHLEPIEDHRAWDDHELRGFEPGNSRPD